LDAKVPGTKKKLESLLKDQDGIVCPADVTTGYAQEYLSSGNEQILIKNRLPMVHDALNLHITWEWVILSDPERFHRHVEQGRNLCTVDSVLALCMRMSVGLVKIDQLPLEELEALPEPAKSVRKLVAQRWGMFCQSTLNTMRDELAKQVFSLLSLFMYPKLTWLSLVNRNL
jgi:hypothetical protein